MPAFRARHGRCAARRWAIRCMALTAVVGFLATVMAFREATSVLPATRSADPADFTRDPGSQGGGTDALQAADVAAVMHRPAEQTVEIVRLQTVDQPPPSVPVVFVSRNRLPTIDGIHVGPGLDIIGRELTPGGRLMVWYPGGEVVDLTGSTGLYDVQQPDVSFDGRRIAFAAVTKPKGMWRLYEIGLDGTGLRQLTPDERGFIIPPDPTAPGRNEATFGRFGDFGPAYLPDGRIMFVSTRYATLSASCGHRGLNLYVLDPRTGQYWRRTTLRSGALDPVVLSNGMVAYSFWIDLMSVPALDGPGIRPLELEYNFAPSLWGIWAMAPDGSNNGRIVFGAGGLTDYGGLHQARELPDGDLVVTVRAAAGLLSDTLASALLRVKPGLVAPQKLRFVGDPSKLEAPHAIGAAPLPDGRIVCSYTLTPTIHVDWQGEHTAEYDFGLYILDAAMEKLTPLYDRPETDELDAVAVMPRRAPVIPDLPESDKISDDPRVNSGLTARLINRNVYADLPLELVDVPSPKVGTVARVDVYDDSQVFTTAPGFPSLAKQMPRFLGSFPVDAHGAFTATVPTDRALMYILVNRNGVATRTTLAPTREDRPPSSVVHFFGHDYLRPNGDFVCTGCHRGHMIDPDAGMAAKANLARLAKVNASSERQAFYNGAWRATDLRLADGSGNWAWATDEGPGAWLQLDWPMPVVAERVLIYPLRARGTWVTAATLALSDGSVEELTAAPIDGKPQEVLLDPPRSIRWLRITIDDAVRRTVGIAEVVVNGPADVALPDQPPLPPTNLRATHGVISLSWDAPRDPAVAGYKLYYGLASGELTRTIDVGDVSSFVMTEDHIRDGETYFVAAKSYNAFGRESIGASNEVTATARAPVVLDIVPDRGPTGGFTPVTVTGRNFMPGLQLKIGHAHALNVKLVDSETITAQTHWHSAGTFDVTVTNADDLKGILPQAFTYYRPERSWYVKFMPYANRPPR